jgi:17beta-estradiol 17-dehydrogenase / very-long-chain 3-oxoacyl-CoA reductase
VNNVGLNYEYPMPVCEVPPAKAWELINVNVGAVTGMSRLVLPGMVARGRGALVNVSSGAELQPLPLMTIYAATKVLTCCWSTDFPYTHEEIRPYTTMQF